jgi:hypothetical protein
MSAPGPRAAAKKAGRTRYFGNKLCPKHPEVRGERMTSNKRCVVCLKSQSKQYIRQWKSENAEHINTGRRNDKVRAQTNARRNDATRENERIYQRTRRNTDPQYRIRNVLKTRIQSALKYRGVKKKLKTIELIGCDVAFLIKHLENKFLPGMTWQNHGPVWHIDHINPISSFDLCDPEQQRACFHFSNLQPLWWHINLRIKRGNADYQPTEADLLPPSQPWSNRSIK